MYDDISGQDEVSGQDKVRLHGMFLLLNTGQTLSLYKVRVNFHQEEIRNTLFRKQVCGPDYARATERSLHIRLWVTSKL